MGFELVSRAVEVTVWLLQPASCFKYRLTPVSILEVSATKMISTRRRFRKPRGRLPGAAAVLGQETFQDFSEQPIAQETGNGPPSAALEVCGSRAGAQQQQEAPVLDCCHHCDFCAIAPATGQPPPHALWRIFWLYCRRF